MKSADKKVMSVMVAVSVLGGSMLAGGITGYHQSDAIREYLNAKDDDSIRIAKQRHRFWSMMRIAADITAVCAGYASGILIKDAFNLGKH